MQNWCRLYHDDGVKYLPLEWSSCCTAVKTKTVLNAVRNKMKQLQSTFHQSPIIFPKRDLLYFSPRRDAVYFCHWFLRAWIDLIGKMMNLIVQTNKFWQSIDKNAVRLISKFYQFYQKGGKCECFYETQRIKSSCW